MFSEVLLNVVVNGLLIVGLERLAEGIHSYVSPATEVLPMTTGVPEQTV